MASYQMVIFFLLPVILMSSSYYSVITALWRSTMNMTALTSTSGGRAPGQPGLESGDEVTMARRGSLHSDKPFTMRTSYIPGPASEKQIGDQLNWPFGQYMYNHNISKYKLFLRELSDYVVSAPYDFCIGIQISRLLTVGSMFV